MRFRIAIAAVAVLLCACGSSAARPQSTSAAPPSAAPACGPAGAKTLAADRQARVFVNGGHVYGCVRGSAHARLLGSTSCLPSGPQIAPVVLTRRLAAYGSERCGIDTGTSEVIVERLGDGKMLARENASTARLKPESYVRVTGVVLAPDGAVAWISTAHSVTGGSAYATQVLAVDSRGMRQLDSGAAIGTGSLRRAGKTVHWRHGGALRSATLA